MGTFFRRHDRIEHELVRECVVSKRCIVLVDFTEIHEGFFINQSLKHVFELPKLENAPTVDVELLEEVIEFWQIWSDRFDL